MGDNEYVYNNYNDSVNEMTQEEIVALATQQAAEIAEEERQHRERQAEFLRSHSSTKRIGRFLQGQPGTQRLISKARGSLNTRRKGETRRRKIQNNIATARREFKQFVNTAANERFFPNAHYDALLREAQNAEQRGNAEEAISLIDQINEGRAEKASFKLGQMNALRQALHNSAVAENARIYANTKTVLESEPAKHRQTVLKIAALDDLMLNEKKKLKLSLSNEERSRAATRLYNIEELKAELNTARHESKIPTSQQNARYAALIAGVNFSTLNSSIYPRLLANNAELGQKNKAVTKIQTAARGYKARKTLKQLKNVAAETSLPMVPINYLPPPTTVVAPTEAQKIAARAARLSRFAKGGRSRKQKN